MAQPENLQDASVLGEQTQASEWPFIGQHLPEQSQETTVEDGAQAETGAEAADLTDDQRTALQLYNALMDPDSRDQALGIVHALVGHKPQTEAKEETKSEFAWDFGKKPDDWSDDDQSYFNDMASRMTKSVEGYVQSELQRFAQSLGLDKATVEGFKRMGAESEQRRKQSEAVSKAQKLFPTVKAELKKNNLAFPDFTQEQYNKAIAAYPGYKYQDAVKLYLQDVSQASARGQAAGKPGIAPAETRRADAEPPSGDLAETLSRSLRQKMMSR